MRIYCLFKESGSSSLYPLDNRIQIDLRQVFAMLFHTLALLLEPALAALLPGLAIA